jgi:hypothetical protein
MHLFESNNPLNKNLEGYKKAKTLCTANRARLYTLSLLIQRGSRSTCRCGKVRNTTHPPTRISLLP